MSYPECIVHKEWRICYDKAYYSVPYRYIGKRVVARITSDFVRVFYASYYAQLAKGIDTLMKPSGLYGV